MKTAKNINPQLFEFWHVTDMIVGIPKPQLNLLLQRKLFGITALVSGRRGSKSSRRFDTGQVLGIGLAWMLSKSGLRAEVIRQVLCNITESNVAVASQAALELVQTGYPYLVVLRDMPIPGETKDEAEIAELTTEVSFPEGLPDLLSRNFGKSALVCPMKNVFDRIDLGIEIVERLQKRQGG